MTFLSGLARRLFRGPQPATHAFTFEGVYGTFAEVPRCGDPFREGFAEESAAGTLATMRLITENPEATVSPRDGGLLALIATEIAQRNGVAKILDFGGAAGIDYVLIRALTQRDPIEIDYTVVDNSKMCDLARNVHSRDPAIRFDTDIDSTRQYDVVHASASICYVDDWQAVIHSLLALESSYFLLSNTFAGEPPTFASGQMNVPGSVIPFWFFSRDDLMRLFDAAGYALVVDVPTGREYDQLNFPAERRQSRARNLVFRKKAE